MKKFLIGVLIGCLLMMTTPVLADSILQSIDVVMNGVNVQLEGQDVEVNSILYNGSTYLPMRKVAELVGKDIEWEQDTMTANIVERIDTKEGVDLSEQTTEEYKIIQGDASLPEIVEIDGEEYYGARYILELTSTEHKNITWTYNSPGFSMYKISKKGDEEVLINSLQYKVYKDRTFISKNYYENTILPLAERYTEEIGEDVVSYEEFRDMFKYEASLNGLLRIQATYKGKMNKSEFKEFWENMNIKTKEQYYIDIAKEKQLLNPEYTADVFFYYYDKIDRNLYLGFSKAYKFGDASAYVENPFETVKLNPVN